MTSPSNDAIFPIALLPAILLVHDHSLGLLRIWCVAYNEVFVHNSGLL